MPVELQLFEASPAWAFVDDTLVGFDLSFTRGLRLAGLDTICNTDAELEQISTTLFQSLCRIPDGYTARFYSAELRPFCRELERFQQQFPEASFGARIAAEKSRQFDHGANKRELIVTLSSPSVSPFSPINPRLLGRRAGRMLDKARALHDQGVSEVGRAVQTLQHGLSAAGVVSRPLSTEELFDAAWALANPSICDTRPTPTHRSDVVARTQLFSSGLLNASTFFCRDGRYHRVITLRTPPNTLVPTQMLPMQSLPMPHVLATTLVRVPDQVALERVERNRSQGHELDTMLSKIRGADRHANMPDHALEQRRSEAEDVLAKIHAGDALFDVNLQCWLSAKSVDDLDESTELVRAQLRGCGQAEGAIEELRGRFAFLSMLPGHHILMGDRYHPMLASVAADLLPVFASNAGHSRPTALFRTRAGELVGFHPFDNSLPAWNATIAGGTGSGKSFTARSLLTGWLSKGGRVVVVTRGKDYHRYGELFDADITDVSSSDPSLELSPFPPYAALTAETRTQVLEHLANVITVMTTEAGSTLDRLQRRVIYKATELAYSQPNGSAAPGFDHWMRCLSSIAEAEATSVPFVTRVLQQMRFWLDGPFGPALRRARAQTADTQMSIWNLERIPDKDTQGVIFAILSNLITQSIELGPTIVVFDEVWAVLKSDAGAHLVETLYRTVRKMGSCIWTISQSINDFFALPSSIRSAVLNNSPLKFFLRLDTSDVEAVSEIFQLNERERHVLSSLEYKAGEYSEILSFMGPRRQVWRHTPTPLEYWCATSHKTDLDVEDQFLAANPNLTRQQVIEHLAAAYPNGAIHVAEAA